jgi:hypothetical protein
MPPGKPDTASNFGRNAPRDPRPQVTIKRDDQTRSSTAA